MSGGVDSSAAALLLKEQGYECVGCTMQLLPAGPSGAEGAATAESRGFEGTAAAGTAQAAAAGTAQAADSDDVQGGAQADARRVAEQLGMPFFVFPLEREFRREVVAPFVETYLQGRTPNPCITCNRCLKFGVLFRKMQELQCDVLATGHYARTEQDPATGRWLLKKAADPAKDQSYVLFQLTQEQLPHVRFPLGELTKKETRGMAERAGLATANKKESQDICFIPDGDYAGFIARFREEVQANRADAGCGTGNAGAADGCVTGNAGAADGWKAMEPGDFTDMEGRVLGRHKGLIHYTIGQRKGLGLPAEHPWYVQELDPENNRVVLGSNEELFRRTVFAEHINLIPVDQIPGEMRVQARIRYRHREQPATVIQTGPDSLKLVFDEPQRAVTPGQAVVLYQGDLVVGGGIITGSAP